MTGLFIDIDDHLGDPIEFEIERAIKYLQVIEEYDYIPSSMNAQHERRAQ